MGVIIETKTIRLKLPTLIEEFYYALQSEDYEECKELKEHFYGEYEKFNDRLKSAFKNYLSVYLTEHKIDNDKDLNGLFNDVFTEEIEEKIES